MIESFSTKQRGIVYTFYSFKGGVGRSMALANIATLLALWGKRVLVIDWDLEAPGIEKYFASHIPRGAGRRDIPGLIELVAEVAQCDVTQQPCKPQWRNHLIRATVREGATIDIITAGRDDHGYVSRLRHLQWENLFSNHRFGELLERMRTEWIDEYDFVLIDSRTGITDIGGICTIHLPDVIITLFTANEQNLHGVKDVMQRARHGHNELPLDRSRLLVLPVPARDESDREYRLAEEWRTRFATELKEFFDDWAPRTQNTEDILNLLKVPYFSYWSFGERLPVLEEDPQNPKTLAGAFAFLAKLVMSRIDWDQAVRGASMGVTVAMPTVRTPHVDILGFIARTAAKRFDYTSERQRHEKFVGRAGLLVQLDQLLVDGSSDCWVVVTGGPGMGKSALLAAWLARREAAGTTVPHHFIRRGAYDWDDPAKLVDSMVAQIEERFAKLRESDVDARMHPAARLARVLSRVSESELVPRSERLVLLIDGLDEYDPPAGIPLGDPLSAFLPHALPLGISLLCSSRPRHPYVSGLELRDGNFIQIDLDDPASAADNDATVRAFWEREARSLGLDPHSSDDTRFLDEVVSRAGGNVQHAVQLRKQLAALPADHRRDALHRIEDIPRGLAALIALSWERIAIHPTVVVGLSILCAAREALTLDELGIVAEWDGDSQRRVFIRGAKELLVETHRPDGKSEYRLHHDSIRAHIARQISSVMLSEHHRSIAMRLATWPAPRDPMSRRYALRHALIHRAEAGDWEDALRLAADVSFLEAKCRELGVHETEADVMRLAERCRANGEAALSQRADDLARALARESHWLRAAPEATAALLWNRLRRSGWSASDLDGQIRVPAGAAFLRVRHAKTRESPALVRDLVGHLGNVTSCAVTPDGRRVVSASDDHTLKTWDLETGRALTTFRGHALGVTGCALTMDGRRVISASFDQTLKVWDLDTGHALATLKGHNRGVSSCAVALDAQRVVSGSHDRTLMIWDLDTGRAVATLHGHSDVVTACAVTPDGRRVVSASRDRTLKIWDLLTGAELATLAGHTGEVTVCVVSPDGSRVVSAAFDRVLKVWDLETASQLTTLEGHDGEVTACAVTPDGQRVVSTSGDQTLKLWDLDTGRALATFHGHTDVVRACAVTPDGRRAVSASYDQTLKVWDLEIGHALATVQGHTDSVTACVVTPDGRRLISASLDRMLRVWDLASGRALAALEGHNAGVTACAVTPDGRRIVSASDDRTLRISDLETGRLLAALEGHTVGVRACAVTPDGRRMISASGDQTLKVWDLSTGRALATFQGHSLGVTACGVTPDGQRVVSASHDRTLKVWELNTGRMLATLHGHSDGVTACIVTPDGRRAISASDDRTLKVWDLENTHALATLEGHTDWVSACAVTPDGRHVVSASHDRTLKVWDLESYACVVTHRGDAPYLAAAVTQTIIIIGDSGGGIWFLDWPR